MPLPELPNQEIKPIMKDFKIQVTIDESILVQKTLFKLGIVWNSGSSDIHNTDSKCLFIRNDIISYFDNIAWFRDQNLPELTFEEFTKLYIKPMETKTFSIQIPEGFEIDKDKSTFECIVFKETSKKPVRITKWEDFKVVKGWDVTSGANILSIETNPASPLKEFKNTWPTKELAEASLALCQLIRYRDNWNESWVADWTNRNQNKYCITVRLNHHAEVEVWNNMYRVLGFENSIIAKEFLETFKALITIASPLL